MRGAAEKYYLDLSRFMGSIRATGAMAGDMDFYMGIESACDIIKSQVKYDRKVIFIGNGASAAISSHMATDFWKNGGIKAMAFNDSSLLTCIGNDYGYKYVFEKSIDMFAEEGDVLVAVSSSGQSENILCAVKTAKKKQCKVITMSGFAAENPLSILGDVNFHVPAKAYGPVEILHQSICHCILDVILEAKNGQI